MSFAPSVPVRQIPLEAAVAELAQLKLCTENEVYTSAVLKGGQLKYYHKSSQVRLVGTAVLTGSTTLLVRGVNDTQVVSQDSIEAVTQHFLAANGPGEILTAMTIDGSPPFIAFKSFCHLIEGAMVEPIDPTPPPPEAAYPKLPAPERKIQQNAAVKELAQLKLCTMDQVYSSNVVKGGQLQFYHSPPSKALRPPVNVVGTATLTGSNVLMVQGLNDTQPVPMDSLAAAEQYFMTLYGPGKTITSIATTGSPPLMAFTRLCSNVERAMQSGDTMAAALSSEAGPSTSTAQTTASAPAGTHVTPSTAADEMLFSWGIQWTAAGQMAYLPQQVADSESDKL